MPRKKAPEGVLANRKLQKTYIPEWRAHREMSQAVLASRVEDLMEVSFTASTLSRIENGLQPYHQAQLEAIAIALQCSTADLLSRHPDAPPLISMQGVPEGDAQRVYDFIRALRVSRPRDPGEPDEEELPQTTHREAVKERRRSQ